MERLLEKFRELGPFGLAGMLTALCRGLYYKLYFAASGGRVRIGFPFYAYGTAVITGPGRVTIGKNCAVFENVFKGLTIQTLSEDAIVEIGDGCALGGTTIRARGRVVFGGKVMTAVCLVQDVSYVNANSADEGAPSPIVLGENVWLGADSVILSGTRIAGHSVISAGSFCMDAEVKEYCLASGSPIKRPLPIEMITKMRARA